MVELLLWTVLIAPGFVAVMTAITLAGIEREIQEFTLTVWSLVSSLLIDTVFLALYQSFVRPVSDLGAIETLFFRPAFQYHLIIVLLLLSVGVGIAYSIAIIGKLPIRARELVQTRTSLRSSQLQPWVDFMRDSDEITIETTDDRVYRGNPVAWSKADKPNEVRIIRPFRLDEDTGEFERVEGPSMLFLANNIDRIVMRKPAEQYRKRVQRGIKRRNPTRERE